MDIIEKIQNMLEEIKPEAEKGYTTLIDDEILDSFDIIFLIGEMSEEFNIQIPASEIIPDNFNSVESLAKMVERLSN